MHGCIIHNASRIKYRQFEHIKKSLGWLLLTDVDIESKYKEESQQTIGRPIILMQENNAIFSFYKNTI